MHYPTALLHRLEQLFASTTSALAQACSSAGAIDARSLDAHQGPCFELAWARAEMQAALALAQSHQGADDLQGALALAFIAEATVSTLARLEAIHIDLQLGLTPLQQFASSTQLHQLRAKACSSQALAHIGAQVIDHPECLAFACADPDVAMARDAFARFAAEVVMPLAQGIHRQNLTVPDALLQSLREMGVFGLSIPQEFGGSASGGASDNALMIAVTEVLSEASLAAAGSLITRPEILARALLTGGTARQKAHWLPLIASGERLCAIAITEPDHGSDVAGLTLAATRCEGGWRLRGAKSWCTFAGKAQLLMVVARTERDRTLGHRGLSVFLVEKPSFNGHDFEWQSPGGGTLSGKAIPTIGYRGMHSFDVSFNDLFVSDAHLIGEAAGLNKGFYYTMAGMTGGRLQTAGRACGVMRGAIKAAIQHALDRRVFGAQLSSYPLTQIKIARMAARYLACRQLAETTAGGVDRPAHAMEASLAKLLACRSAELVTRDAQQLHGAMGYAEETPVSRMFVDARVLSIFEGAEETLALKVVARGLLEDALTQGAGV